MPKYSYPVRRFKVGEKAIVKSKQEVDALYRIGVPCGSVLEHLDLAGTKVTITCVDPQNCLDGGCINFYLIKEGSMWWDDTLLLPLHSNHISQRKGDADVSMS